MKETFNNISVFALWLGAIEFFMVSSVLLRRMNIEDGLEFFMARASEEEVEFVKTHGKIMLSLFALAVVASALPKMV